MFCCMDPYSVLVSTFKSSSIVPCMQAVCYNRVAIQLTTNPIIKPIQNSAKSQFWKGYQYKLLLKGSFYSTFWPWNWVGFWVGFLLGRIFVNWIATLDCGTISFLKALHHGLLSAKEKAALLVSPTLAGKRESQQLCVLWESEENASRRHKGAFITIYHYHLPLIVGAAAGDTAGAGGDVEITDLNTNMFNLNLHIYHAISQNNVQHPS